MRDELQAVYNQLYGLPVDRNGDGIAESFADLREGGARLDVAILNTIGIQASALGNHEFDLGTNPLREAIGQDVRGALPQNVRWLGVDFPISAPTWISPRTPTSRPSSRARSATRRISMPAWPT